jgi:sulfur carrier protein
VLQSVDLSPPRVVPALIAVVLNGTRRQFEAPLSVSALLASLALAGRRVAVEVNGEIVPRSAHAATAVVDGDRVEVVVAVGGG